MSTELTNPDLYFSGHKICSKCGKKFSIENFGIRRTKSGTYLRSWCKSCENLQSISYAKRNPQKIKYWNKKGGLKRSFGITIEVYNSMFNSQNGKCAICGNPNQSKMRSLTVDHDHKTGKIRMLLCDMCNKGLGFFGDDIELMEKAIEYLKYHRNNEKTLKGEK